MLGQYLNLEINNAMLHYKICNVIATYLVDDAILGEYGFDLAKAFGVDTVKIIQIEMQEKNILNEIEIEEKRRADEMQMQLHKLKRRV